MKEETHSFWEIPEKKKKKKKGMFYHIASIL
jgi:hypothetical protein